MGWASALNHIFERYAGVGVTPSSSASQDFHEVAQTAPPHVLADGLTHAFQSDQTPAFPEMVANLFRQSNPDQRAGLLNRLLGSLGPGAMAVLPGLSGLFQGGSAPQVTPQQANQVSPEQVQQAAAQAERTNPSIVNEISHFYSQHPEVFKALGGLALAIAIQHISRRR